MDRPENEALIKAIQKIQPDRYIRSAPLADLAPIHLSDLQPLTRAEGRVLHGVLEAEPHKVRDTIQVITKLRDSRGDSVFLGINHLIASRASQDQARVALPLGSRVAIKEPTLDDSIESHPFIGLDNPANLVVLSYLSDAQLEIFRGMSPAEIRSQGNQYLKAGCFEAAAQAYHLGFHRAEQGDPREQLLALSSQAECYLKLGRFEDCIDVADEALALDPTHCKSIYRKASALIELHLYDWAAKLLESFSGEIDTVQESAIGELRSRARKLAEQSHSGTSVLEAITGYVEQVATVTPSVKFPELAEYVGPVEVRMCPDQKLNRGRGLFATRDISKGEVVIATRATISEPGSFPFVDLAMKSPRRYQQLSSLAGEEVPEMKLFAPNWITDEEWSGYRGYINRERLLVVEKMHKVASSTSGDISPTWPLELFINHSCIPNVCKTSSGETLYMLATREIAAGEEIVYSYISPCHPRRRGALNDLRIRCDCMKCEVERKLQRGLEEVRRCCALVREPSSDVGQMVAKLEEVLNSELESEEERLCVRATLHSSLYALYYAMVLAGKVDKLPGIPPAEVIMAAAQKFSAGGNACSFMILGRFADDRAAAEKIMREEWECKFGVVEDDRVYEAAIGCQALLKVMVACCH